MIPPAKFAKLAPRHRLRKAALVLGEVERGLLGAAAERSSQLVGYAAELAPLCAAAARSLAPQTEEEGRQLEIVGAAAATLRGLVPAYCSAEEAARAVDGLRHALLAATGQACADWDLIDPRTGLRDPGRRLVHPGVRVYVEDLRSPFNIGAIFRTADAFGVEEILLSPLAAGPRHPRALRSSMGAVDLVPWRRAELAELSGPDPVFALELGGTQLADFSFPERGIAVIGSEELGVSPQAIARCSLGSVSIPMAGAKASLNVAVAFGILMYAWSSSGFR